MTQIALNMNELFALEAEITGVAIKDQVVLKGLLQQDISYVQKFRLEDIISRIQPYKERLNKLREELIQKFGTSDADGMIAIHEYLDGEGDEKKVNPDYVVASKEIKDLLDMDVTIEVYPFAEQDFQFKASEYYPVFNKLVRKVKELTMIMAA